MPTTDVLWIDYETYSDQPIKQSGTHEYFNSPNYYALMLSYAFNDESVLVHIFDDSQNLPEDVAQHIIKGGTCRGWSQFDRLATLALGLPVTNEQYEDVMVCSLEAGYPASLGLAGEMLQCNVKKDPIGKAAIHKFCKPKKGERVMPSADWELWEQFVAYARHDTALMREIYATLPPMLPAERKLQLMDMRMNDRGVKLDREGCILLSGIAEQAKERLNEIMATTTDNEIQTIGQVAKIASYCGITNASEEALSTALAGTDMNPSQRMVAQLRLRGAKTSAAKIPKMLSTMNPLDDRSRGSLQFAHTITKRWAGRNWQPHNLPRVSFKPDETQACIDAARLPFQSFVKQYPDPMLAISMCLRGLVIPAAHHRFIVADYASIEARVLVWFANQANVLREYEQGVDVYKTMAGQVFGVPVDDVTTAQRFLGKTLVLGSGYGLGWAGLQRNLAKFGTNASDDQCKRYTSGYRNRFNRVVGWWDQIVSAMTDVEKGSPSVKLPRLTFAGTDYGSIYIELPTGNRLWYHDVRTEDRETPWGEMKKCLTAQNPRAIEHRYVLTHSILAENICSALSREILARGMYNCEQAGYPPVLSIHDEVVLEVENDKVEQALPEVEAILCKRPPWGRQLPLATEAFACDRYCK